MKNFKKAIALLLAAVLLVAASVMGTIAYLTDSDADVNTMSAGNVYIVQNETDRNGDAYQDGKKLIPAVYDDGGLSYDSTMKNTTGEGALQIWDKSVENELDKVISVTNTGTEAAYIRTILLVENNAANTICEKVHTLWCDTDGQYAEWVVIPGTTTEDMVTVGTTTYSIAVCTYNTAIEAGKTSAPSLMQVFLDPTADNSWYDLLGADGEFSIIAFSQAVQKQGFDNAEKALNEAFGEVSSAKVTEWLATTGIASTGNDNIIGGVTKP